MQFRSDEHKRRFNDLCERDKTNIKDIERCSLFYIFSGTELLYKNIEMLYDFEDHTIRLEAYNQAFLTGGTRSLIDLAFSLYGSEAECEVRFCLIPLITATAYLHCRQLSIDFKFQLRLLI